MEIIYLLDAYEVSGMALAVGIVIFSVLSIYYNVLWLRHNPGLHYRWIKMFTVLVSFLWVITFGFVLISAVLGNQPIDSQSFGAVFLRPVVLLSAVGNAISAKARCRFND